METEAMYIMRGTRTNEVLIKRKYVADNHIGATKGKMPQYYASDGEHEDWSIVGELQLPPKVAEVLAHNVYKSGEVLLQELNGCCGAYKKMADIQKLLAGK